MKVLTGASNVTVTIWSTDSKRVIGTTMGDATSDILSVTTTKDLTTPAGSFQIQLVPRLDASGETWFDKIHAWDFVEVKFKGIKDEKEKVVMRGLVDSIEKSEDYQAGVPNRKITVSGRDLGSLLTDFLIYYIPELGKQEAIRSMLKVLAWEVNPKLMCNAKEAFEFMCRYWFDQMDLFIQIGHQEQKITSFINTSAESFYPRNLTSMLFLLSYEGPWWNAFEEYRDKPFHELFIYDDDKYSWFILRPSRLKDAQGSLPPVVDGLINSGYTWMYPENMVIEREEKIASSIQKNSNEVCTWYFTVPTQELISKQSFRSVAISPNLQNPKASVNPYIASNPNFPSYIKKYGFRPREAKTNFIFLDAGQLSGQGGQEEWPSEARYVERYSGKKSSQGEDYVSKVIVPNYVERGQEMNKTLVAWFLHNPLLLSGNIEIPGTNRSIVGTYVWDKDDDMQYYVEGVTHTFIQLQSFRTQLRITRGMPIGGLTEKGDVNVFYFSGDLPENVRAPKDFELTKASALEKREWPSEARYAERYKEQQAKTIKKKKTKFTIPM